MVHSSTISQTPPKSFSTADGLELARMIREYGVQALQEAISLSAEAIVGTPDGGRGKPVEKAEIPELPLEVRGDFRNLFGRHSAIMLLVDPPTGAILDANDAAAEFYGYSKNDLRAKNIRELNMLSDGQIRTELVNAVSDHRNYFHFPHKLASGEERLVEVHSSPIEFNRSKILFSVIHDITERKLLERNLVESEKRYRAIFNLSREFIGLLDPDGIVIEANRTSLDFIGTDIGAIVGKPFWEGVWWSYSPDAQKTLIEAIREAKNGKFVRKEVIHLDIE